MLKVRKVNERFTNCLNCGKSINREIEIQYEPWYTTPIQLCEDCLKEALETLVSYRKGESEK